MAKPQALNRECTPYLINKRKWHVSQHHNGYLGWSPAHGPKAQGFQITAEDFGNHPYSYRKGGKPEPVTEIGIDDFAVSKTRPQSAIRPGRYKLLYFYDLVNDPGEQNDLSESLPEKATELRARLDAYLTKVDARLPEPVR